jgi:hypothetical protein
MAGEPSPGRHNHEIGTIGDLDPYQGLSPLTEIACIPYGIDAILNAMRAEWTDEFDNWLSRIESKAEAGDEHAELQLDYVGAELLVLQELTEPPEIESAQLKRVRQRRRHEIWRVSHRFDSEVAVRIICWFPPGSNRVVVALFAGDKKPIGDVFYNSVASRADAAIDRWILHEQPVQTGYEREGEDDDD